MSKFCGPRLVMLVLALPLACSANNGTEPSEGQGGTPSSGGAQQSAGGTQFGSGGSSNASGGTLASGGTTSNGGTTSGGMGSGGVTKGGASNGGTTGGGAPAKGGSTAAGGSVAKGGAPATGGTSASGGNTGSGGSTTSTCTPWPKATTTQSVSATIPVSGTYDGGLKRYVGSGALAVSGQEEDADPIFELADGATLKNVILGNPAADGIHCKGTCTLQNVWWEDVGEDAATLLGSNSSQTMTIDCAGAKAAADKVLQHNGPGTMIVRNFWVSDFGKLYRSCGNCSSQYTRHAQFFNVTATTRGTIAGINKNYKDTAEFHNITIVSGSSVCDLYDGNSSGAEPTKLSSGNDGTYCIYSASEIHTQ
ncbi:MAG: pectate lyase [Myxococcota bacterium]